MFDKSFYFKKWITKILEKGYIVPLLEIAVLASVVALGYFYMFGAIKLYLPRAPYVHESHQWGYMKTFTVIASAVIWPASWAVVSLYRLRST